MVLFLEAVEAIDSGGIESEDLGYWPGCWISGLPHLEGGKPGQRIEGSSLSKVVGRGAPRGDRCGPSIKEPGRQTVVGILQESCSEAIRLDGAYDTNIEVGNADRYTTVLYAIDDI